MKTHNASTGIPNTAEIDLPRAHTSFYSQRFGGYSFTGSLYVLGKEWCKNIYFYKHHL